MAPKSWVTVLRQQLFRRSTPGKLGYQTPNQVEKGASANSMVLSWLRLSLLKNQKLLLPHHHRANPLQHFPRSNSPKLSNHPLRPISKITLPQSPSLLPHTIYISTSTSRTHPIPPLKSPSSLYSLQPSSPPSSMGVRSSSSPPSTSYHAYLIGFPRSSQP